MCETRDLGIGWPYRHTLIFGNDIKIDMPKRRWYRRPVQFTGRNGQPSTSMKS